MAISTARKMKTISDDGTEGEMLRVFDISEEVEAEFAALRAQVDQMNARKDAQKIGLQQLAGIIVYPCDNRNWIIKKPKMAARIAMFIAAGEVDALTPEQKDEPAYLEAMAELVRPVLFEPKLLPDGKFVQMSRELILEHFDLPDVFDVLAIARGRNAQEVVEDAGLDPNS